MALNVCDERPTDKSQLQAVTVGRLSRGVSPSGRAQSRSATALMPRSIAAWLTLPNPITSCGGPARPLGR